MKCIKFFLPLALLAFGCQSSEEEQMNLDEMAQVDEELDPQHSASLEI